MLVLSRKPGQKVHVGSDITVAILAVSGKRVRIGLTAPAQIRIAREELNAPLHWPCLQGNFEPEEMHHAAGNP